MRRRRVSALRGGNRRFQRSELARAGVQRVCAAEGDRLVPAGVAEGRSEDHRDREGSEALGYDFLAASRVFPRREEIADDKTLRALERAAEQELRAHRPLDRRHAPAAPELVQDRRVAVADDELARKLAQLGCEAEEAVAAASEDQRLGIAAERLVELALAPRIVSREMARPGKDLLPEAGLEADAAQRLDAALEALAIEPARGGDDVDRVPWTERFHARSVP